ncbi:hypothetical protein [Xanthobacter agilis]|jgi:ElaB/YqjD/DUF883 family membrane-anchored ribosome-binding protein|uniref:ElaB/YqjD/DUF883 family membrane-anchored ribosome-binding protein n=1 Tax=Xanthobacter agilis TaxID=47492 RepID=A0ABU0L8J4_XANAG|nr:hypothetical protein [Xanthobacter agilis]MDQ0503459.1 ElaB/YqjD/DUF883 family membrane-anchored ribosome-binding protein [Xanthobacter agilis]
MVEKSTAAKVEEAAEPNLADVRQDLERLRAEIARLLDAAGQGAKDLADEAVTAAEVKVESAGVWAEGRCETVRETIRARPLAACALAAGLGLVLGQVLLRR